jgi:hypothetical protein
MKILAKLTLPEWCLSALINHDFSGLYEDEQPLIYELFRQYPDGIWDVVSPEPYFSWHNDLTYFGGMVVDVAYYSTNIDTIKA